MVGKRLFFALAAGALLLLQFADCTSAMPPDPHGADCCASMPCIPANQGYGCCKTMTSARTPGMLPAAPVPLHPPTLAMAGSTLACETVPPDFLPLATVEAQQHSPPELYTLNVSFRI